ncbi:hypothetical protein FA15DRAFT_754648 [Coprinopsis marcescibilis]|uniref:DUF6533 domain-containing protein n=1 Tax=Coprinopsis marcescibilis TaxID=230819 RepID=A0A5C3L1V6_COPMA|nr:hypothetical protein FA15DRAFT_754648 [Coprinopsis marcescibilis]
MSDAETLVTLASSIFVNNAVLAASMTIFIYDYIQSLDDEIGNIWPGRINLGKVLFLLARYPTFIDLPRLPKGLGYNNWSVFNYIAILVVSICALLGNNRIATTALTAFYLLATVTGFVLLGLFLREVDVEPLPYFSPTVCVLFWENDYMYYNYCLLLGGELAFTIIAAVVGFRKYRNSNSAYVVLLYRDGFLFYFTLLVLSTLSVIAPYILPIGYSSIFTSVQRSLHPVLANRLLLDMRKLPSRDPTRNVSDLAFNSKSRNTAKTSYSFGTNPSTAYSGM